MSPSDPLWHRLHILSLSDVPAPFNHRFTALYHEVSIDNEGRFNTQGCFSGWGLSDMFGKQRCIRWSMLLATYVSFGQSLFGEGCLRTTALLSVVQLLFYSWRLVLVKQGWNDSSSTSITKSQRCKDFASKICLIHITICSALCFTRMIMNKA